MKKLCSIYRSPKEEGMYLYVDKDNDLASVPEALLKRFGQPELAITLLLTPDKKLARADVAKVLEAIEEQDASLIDPSDFSDADNVRFDFELPKEQYLTDSDAREEIKDWVLELCTTSSVSQSLPSPSQAQGTVYEALFASREPLCIVTGFPIPPKNRLEVNGSIANKEHWNFMVSRTRKCPWTGKDQTPIY